MLRKQEGLNLFGEENTRPKKSYNFKKITNKEKQNYNLEEDIEKVEEFVSEILDYDKCPNCDEYSLSSLGKCNNCGYGKGEEYYEEMKRKEEEKEIKKFFKKMERKEKKEEEREKTISDAYKIIETLKNNKTHYHMSTVAEILKLKDIFGLRKGLTGENILFDILRKHKIFYYDENKDNIPYEKFINEGYFVVDISKKPDNRGNRHNVSKATVKGLKFILNVVVGAIEKV